MIIHEDRTLKQIGNAWKYAARKVREQCVASPDVAEAITTNWQHSSRTVWRYWRNTYLALIGIL